MGGSHRNRPGRAWLALALALAGLWAASAGLPPAVGRAAGETIVITLHSAEVRGPQISLGEVADLEGGSEEERAALTRLILGQAALPGAERQLSRATVLVRLRGAGYPEERLVWSGPEAVTVRTAGRILTAREAEPVLFSLLRRRLPSPEWQLEAKVLSWPSSLRIPEGELAWELEASPQELRRAFSAGVLQPTVRALVEGRVVASFRPRLEVLARGAVVVAAADLPPRRVLAREDLSVQVLALKGLPADVAWTQEDLLGQRLVRSVRAGEVLRLSAVEPVPVVEKGTEVVLTVRQRGVVVTAVGRALEDGGQGQVIRVQNVDSGKILQGRVVGPREVEVLR
ncbi:MAG: flagellar basal body P-ring formation chaperone FlgA [Bacillota bacterium]|nr:flagellar basal body P-ring formation chaperone FlgA [Bacillota bacterium]